MSWTLSRRASTMLLYGCGVVLALYELFVLTLARHPQVSEEYQAYFITRESHCWRRPNPEFAYEPGRIITFIQGPEIRGYQPYLGCGWWVSSDWGTRTRGDVAELELRVPPSPTDLVLRVETQSLARSRSAAKIKVFANDAFIANWELPPKGSPAELQAPVPQGLLNDGKLRIRFESVGSSPAANGLPPRPRKLNMSIRRLVMDKAG
jgi:hypothetical protein